MSEPESTNTPPERIPFLELDGESIPEDMPLEVDTPLPTEQPEEPWLITPSRTSPSHSQPQTIPRRWFRLSDLPRSQLIILAGAVLLLLLLLPRLILLLSLFMAELLLLLRLALIPLVAFMVAAMLLRWVNGRSSR